MLRHTNRPAIIVLSLGFIGLEPASLENQVPQSAFTHDAADLAKGKEG